MLLLLLLLFFNIILFRVNSRALRGMFIILFSFLIHIYNISITTYTICKACPRIYLSLYVTNIYRLYIYIYSIYKDFAKQRYNTPYACNVI